MQMWKNLTILSEIIFQFAVKQFIFLSRTDKSRISFTLLERDMFGKVVACKRSQTTLTGHMLAHSPAITCHP